VSPPDIHVIDKNFDAYIEVSRVTDDSTIELIQMELDKIIHELKIPYAIDIDLNSEMSSQAFTSERDIKRTKILNGINDFALSYKNDNNQIIINTSIGMFKIRNIRSALGYVGCILWGGGVDYQKQIEAIKKKVIDKANKRTKWSDKHLNKLLIIALDFEDISIDPDELESALIGFKTIIDVSSSKIIDKAIKKGWDKYFNKIGIERQYNIFEPDKLEIFFTCEVVKNISGVIGLCKGRPPIFFPNPFAYDEINNPKIENYLN
jgi:hypothetical protein